MAVERVCRSPNDCVCGRCAALFLLTCPHKSTGVRGCQGCRPPARPYRNSTPPDQELPPLPGQAPVQRRPPSIRRNPEQQQQNRLIALRRPVPMPPPRISGGAPARDGAATWTGLPAREARGHSPQRGVPTPSHRLRLAIDSLRFRRLDKGLNGAPLRRSSGAVCPGPPVLPCHAAGGALGSPPWPLAAALGILLETTDQWAASRPLGRSRATLPHPPPLRPWGCTGTGHRGTPRGRCSHATSAPVTSPGERSPTSAFWGTLKCAQPHGAAPADGALSCRGPAECHAVEVAGCRLLLRQGKGGRGLDTRFRDDPHMPLAHRRCGRGTPPASRTPAPQQCTGPSASGDHQRAHGRRGR